jgi:hypothetical protein
MQFREIGVCSLFVLVQIIACGGGSSGGGAQAAGAGGSSVSAQTGIPCGAKHCQAPAGYTGEMCCHEPISGTCGLLMSPGMCAAIPAVEEANCPDGTIALSEGVSFVRGCCVMGTNDCGVNVYSSIAAQGINVGNRCDTLAAAQAYADTGSNPSAMSSVPAPTHCDGTPAM